MKNTDKNVSRTYYIIRMHDNKAEVIATASQAEVESGKITFATDKFSTYAIAYADASVKLDDGKKDDRQYEQTARQSCSVLGIREGNFNELQD